MGQSDLYQQLGVNRQATAEQIRKAYKKLARQYHPDVNPGNKHAEDKFKQISSAFNVLSNPEKRKLYDEFGADAERIGFDPEKAKAYRAWQSRSQGGGFDLGDIMGGDRGGFNIGDIFGDIFSSGNRGPRRSSGPLKGQDIESHMTISFRDSILGTERSFQLDKPSGRVQLKVKVPPGIENGQNIRLAGQGAQGRHGGPTGDLYLKVHVTPHPLITRQGRDLYFQLPITIGEAMLGAQVEVPTFSGSIKLRIPLGSQNQDHLRLKEKGVPASKKEAAGDLYVVLDIRLPESKKLTKTAQKAIEQLQRLYTEDVRGKLRL